MSNKHGEQGVGAISRVVTLVLRFRFLALILFLVVTGALFLQLRNIKATMDSVEPMIPSGHPFAATLQAIEEMDTLPESLMVIVEVKSGDIYNTETVAKVERICRELVGMAEIKPGGILSLSTGLNHYDNTVEGLMGEPILGRIPPETEEDFQAVKRRVAVNAMGIGTTVAYDGTATLITAALVNLDTKFETSYAQLSGGEQTQLSLEEYKKKAAEAFNEKLLSLARDLKTKEEDGNHRIYFVGTRTLEAEMTAMGRAQAPVAAVVMLALIVAVLAGYFRSFQKTLVPVFAFAFSVLWGLGLLGAGHHAMNAMAFLFPLMLGILSLVCSALVMNEYDRTRGGTESKLEAIAASYRSAPVVACVLAAGLVSLALLVAGVPMLRELGCLSLFWALGTFVVVVLICPVVMCLLPRPARAGSDRSEDVCRALAEKLAKPFQRSGKVGVSIFLVLLLAAGGFCLWKLGVGDNTPGSAYLRASHPWNQGFRLHAEKFNGPYSLSVHVEAKEKEGLLHPEAINEMGDFSTYLRGEGGARESVAFDWVVKMGRIALMDGNPKWWTVPASPEDVEGLSRLLTFPGGLEILVDPSFSQATILALFPADDQKSIDSYLSTMEGYIDSHPSDYIKFNLAGGLLGITKAINDGTRDAYVKTLALALVTVFVLGFFAVRSLLLSLIVTLAVSAGQALVLLIMAILSWPVSLAAVPAVVVGVGFGAVLGIYLVRQFAAAGDASVEGGEGPGSRWGRAGGGVLFLGTLAFAGTLPWFFIGLKFQADMALVLGVSVAAQTIAALTFIPSLAAAFQE